MTLPKESTHPLLTDRSVSAWMLAFAYRRAYGNVPSERGVKRFWTPDLYSLSGDWQMGKPDG